MQEWLGTKRCGCVAQALSDEGVVLQVLSFTVSKKKQLVFPLWCWTRRWSSPSTACCCPSSSLVFSYPQCTPSSSVPMGVAEQHHRRALTSVPKGGLPTRPYAEDTGATPHMGFRLLEVPPLDNGKPQTKRSRACYVCSVSCDWPGDLPVMVTNGKHVSIFAAFLLTIAFVVGQSRFSSLGAVTRQSQVEICGFTKGSLSLHGVRTTSREFFTTVATDDGRQASDCFEDVAMEAVLLHSFSSSHPSC
ncbi:unnamed protein product [Effrenium voratum]|nr:unnamed protein product [Effrenium voratum]